MKKDTNELLEELNSFSSFNGFIEENREEISSIPVSRYIESIIEEKGLSKSKIIEKAEMSEVYGYQIISGIKKNPKREKILCLAFGMELTFEETQDMLKKTGYAPLYPKNEFDVVLIYGLCKKLSIVEVNNLLFEYGQETLG